MDFSANSHFKRPNLSCPIACLPLLAWTCAAAAMVQTSPEPRPITCFSF
jgi:hypothetical protein